MDEEQSRTSKALPVVFFVVLGLVPVPIAIYFLVVKPMYEQNYRPIYAVGTAIGQAQSLLVDGEAKCTLDGTDMLPGWCEVWVDMGEHRITLAGGGEVLHETSLTIPDGSATQYLWIPELPASICVRNEELVFEKKPTDAPPPPPKPALKPGLHELEAVEYWFDIPAQLAIASGENEVVAKIVEFARCE